MPEPFTLLTSRAEKNGSTGELGPLRATTLSEQCYQRLKTAITNLELRPRTILSENQLAEQLGISKSPVRDALARLSGEGYLVSDGGRKCRVADLDAKTVREFYTVRIYLETSSLREVAPSLGTEDFERLQAIIDADRAFMRSGDLSNVVLSSSGFHLLLIEKSENRQLIRIAKHLFDQANWVRTAIQLAEQESDHQDLSNRGLQNHQLILDSLVSGDLDRSVSLLREDIEIFLHAATSPAYQEIFEKLAVPSK